MRHGSHAARRPRSGLDRAEDLLDGERRRLVALLFEGQTEQILGIDLQRLGKPQYPVERQLAGAALVQFESGNRFKTANHEYLSPSGSYRVR